MINTSSSVNCHPYKGTSTLHAASGYQYVAHYHKSKPPSLLSLPNNQYAPTSNSAPTSTYMRTAGKNKPNQEPVLIHVIPES